MKTFWFLAFLCTVISFFAVNLELAEQYRDFEWVVYQANIDNHHEPNGRELHGYTDEYPCDWVDSIGVTITGMPPEVSISIGEDQVRIECSGAQRSTYVVYSSDSPDGTFTVDETGSFTGDAWSAPITSNRRYYYVVTETGDCSEAQVIGP